MLPVYAKAIDISGFNLSLLVGSAIIGGVILQLPIGYLADRFERRKVMLNIVLFSMVCTLLTPAVLDLDFFIFALVLISFSSGIVSSLYPLGISETFDRLQQNEMGSAIGAMIIIYASGGILGPFTVGLVMEHIGTNFFFISMALMQFLFALFIVYRSRVRKSIPTDQQEAFVAQGATGWVSTELDPRTEYVDISELSPEAQTAVDIALINPKLALKMVSILAKSDPDQILDIAKAVAGVEGVDVTELYQRVNKEDPDNQQELIQNIITATPDSSTELVNMIFEEAESADIAELASVMTEADPEHSLEIIEAATEAVVEDNPEMVVDIAETYANNVASNLEEMRYADRLADDGDGEQTISDMIEMIAEIAPEQVEDVEAAMPDIDSDPFSEAEETDESDANKDEELNDTKSEDASNDAHNDENTNLDNSVDTKENLEPKTDNTQASMDDATQDTDAQDDSSESSQKHEGKDKG
jgi:hypothetical protein